MSFNLGFIGGGHMSTTIFKGILKNNVHPSSNIWVSGPHLERFNFWIEAGANASLENGVVFDNCNIIFLGVKPDKLNTVFDSINWYINNNENVPRYNKRVLFVSMLAGKNLESIKEAIDTRVDWRGKGFKINIIRIMPNTPIAVGSGICLYTPDPEVSDTDCATLERLLSGSALCERIPESILDALGTLTACGPAFIYIVIEALADGAVKQGVPRAIATRLAAHMVAGSGQMVLQSGKHPGLLKDDVCSPGGTTICGVTALEKGCIRATMINAIEASTLRAKELSKK